MLHDGDEQGAKEHLQRDERAGGSPLPRARDWGRPPLWRASARATWRVRADTWFQTRFAGGLPFTDLPEFPRRLPRDRFRLRDHLREASTESPQGCTGEGVGGWLSSTIYRQPSSRPPVYQWGGGVERFRQTLSGFKPKSRDLPERALLGDLGGAMGVDLPGQRGEAEKRLVYRVTGLPALSSPRQESNRY